MNAFQILNNENIPIPINKLDEEVCLIVGVEINPKRYCLLGKEKIINQIGIIFLLVLIGMIQ